MSLVLRPFERGDEAAALAAWHESRREGYQFLTTYDDGQSWSQYLELLAKLRDGRGVPAGLVAGEMLAAVVEDTLIGRLSVRYELNDYLATYGGPIGYAVLRAYRRRGYATQLLRAGLELARAHGVSPVLLTCDDANVASAAVIERCGARLESVGPDEKGVLFRRYWI